VAASSASASLNVVISSGSYNTSTYALLHKELSASLNGLDVSLCFAHSTTGVADLVNDAATKCSHGVVVYGAVPTSTQIDLIKAPILVIAGSRDGVAPLSQFAVSRYHNRNRAKYVAINGASHASVMDSPLSLPLDLKAAISPQETRSAISALVSDFLGLTSSGFLSVSEAWTAQLAKPIVKALELEGSAALGDPWCQSDFPTNPTCNYPSYPQESMAPGPAPPPNPLPPSTCVCGSPWVMGLASEMNADFKDSPRPTATVLSHDAFQDVSDTHPFHLPNIFNECSTKLSSPCKLNVTTVTQSVVKPGDLFPPKAVVLSAFEFKTKFKSRQALWEKAGLGKGTDALDQGTNNCKLINEQAYQWALKNAEASVRDTFSKYGEPYVMVDDVEAPIGIKGPTWIEKEMIYKRVKDAKTGKSRIEIQSWSFCVANTKDGDLPWYFPVGMHYCKLLSPARAMEWIYTEGVRLQLQA